MLTLTESAIPYLFRRVLDSLGLPGTLHNLATINPGMEFMYEDALGDKYHKYISMKVILCNEVSDIAKKLQEWLMEVSIEYRMWGQWPLWLDEPDMNYG